MSRKYRQSGYQSDDNRGKSSRSFSEHTEPKGRVETRYRRTIRCSECSSTVSFIDTVKVTEKCANCAADVRTCRNCRYFDPGAPNQCMKPVQKRVENKLASNICEIYSPKILIEKAIEERRDSVADTARQAFEDLFKI